MPLIEFVAVAVSFVIGYLMGTVYPLWQPEEESEEQKED